MDINFYKEHCWVDEKLKIGPIEYFKRCTICGIYLIPGGQTKRVPTYAKKNGDMLVHINPIKCK